MKRAAGHVLFDMAGTLFASPVNWERENAEGARRVVAHLAAREGQFDASGIARDLLAAARTGRVQAKAERTEYRIERVIEDVLAATGITVDAKLHKELVRIYISPELEVTQLRPGMKKILQDLQADGYQMSIISNAPSKEFVMVPIQQCQLQPIFSHAIISCQIGYRKPHPKFIEAVQKNVRVTPGHAIVVGDRLYDDIGLAKALGVPGILCAIDEHPDNEAYKKEIQPDAIAASVSEIDAHIRRLCPI